MISDSESDLDIPNTPPEIVNLAEKTSAELLPAKSKQRYEEIYSKFIEWRADNHINSYSETVLLAYFAKLSETLKPSTLWSIYSMLRTTLSTYPKLRSFLKRKSDGFKSKKSKTFSAQEINTLTNAPDSKYLMAKVALIFGISGACCCHELKDLMVNDIKDSGNTLLVEIPNIKTKNGKCSRQVVGINKFRKLPIEIAQYLNLPFPQQYTGHRFRRTSAALLMDAGGDLLQLKRHGGWKSSTVAEGYVDESSSNKNQIQTKILQSVQNTGTATTESNYGASSSAITLVNNRADVASSTSIHKKFGCETPIILNNCSNVTINQYLNNK